MTEKTLVCVLGQTRAHELTWHGFEKFVLTELGADLALCIGTEANYDRSNPFYRNAKFRWTCPEHQDYREAYEMVASQLGAGDGWLKLTKFEGNWLGGVNGRIGSGGILLFYRWLLLKNIIDEGVLDLYDRYIITRSDYYYWSPHPPLSVLDPKKIWIPFAEDHGGITDRHSVIARDDLQQSIDFLSELLLNPDVIYNELLRIANWNLERFIYLQFMRRGLIDKVRRYPYVMATVRGETDGATITFGKYDSEEKMIIKYRGELNAARTFRDLLKDEDAWQKFFAEGGFDRLDELTPQRFPRFEERATPIKWATRRFLDRLGFV